MIDADDLLHLVARVLVRVQQPLRAKRSMDALGRIFPHHSGSAAARLAAARLRGGTCLTRALTISARTPGSCVALAVWHPSERKLLAHAWVEVNGQALCEGDTVGEVIARL
jgi:hypothetical protein